MKTLVITAALSVLSLGHIAVAQDGKSIRTQSQIVKEMLEALPTQDTNTEPAPLFSINDLRLIASLPTVDQNVEIPQLINEKEVFVKNNGVDALKAEVKPAGEVRRADK